MYRQHYSTRQTPQNKPIPGKQMVQNSAGGYSFGLDDWKRLERFLILGSAGGTYYIKEKPLTIENAEAVQRCLDIDGIKVVDRIVDISDSGRAPKNDPALFALAMASAHSDVDTRRYALEALPKVARIGTHLFHFAEYVEGFRGWGKLLKEAIQKWYNDKSLDSLAYQAVKYKQRDGWSHRDLLRLSKPVVGQGERSQLYRYMVGKEVAYGNLPPLVAAYEAAQNVEHKSQLIDLILDFNLTREMIPNKWLDNADVWKALLYKMPMTAMIRNLGKMSEVGLLQPMSDSVNTIVNRLTDQEYLRRSRIHPLSVLVALKIYWQGQGMKGSLRWNPISQITDALDEAFYLSFGNVEPSNKRTMLALDVSGSMDGSRIAGMPIDAREGSAAMALVTARTEPNYWIAAFSHEMVRINLSPRERLDDVLRIVDRITMGGTDCALPMITALNAGIEVDTFIVYTDSETWYGSLHPILALDMYRQKTGIPAKLVVVGMTSNGFSIADPSDGGCLDIVGFDTATPQVISEFSKGGI